MTVPLASDNDLIVGHLFAGVKDFVTRLDTGKEWDLWELWNS